MAGHALGIWICPSAGAVCSIRELWASKSAGAHSAKSFKISGCKRWCPKDLRVHAPAAPMLTHSLPLITITSLVYFRQIQVWVQYLDSRKKSSWKIKVQLQNGFEPTWESEGFSERWHWQWLGEWFVNCRAIYFFNAMRKTVAENWVSKQSFFVLILTTA